MALAADLKRTINAWSNHMPEYLYSKTGVKRPLKNEQNKDLNDKW